MTLAVVGVRFPNKGRGPTRREAIAACSSGDVVCLVPEPDNEADENAIAVVSADGAQLGYITAERAPLIGKRLRDGCEIVAVFQRAAEFGAYIRVAFDGARPDLPTTSPTAKRANPAEFYPDPEYDDEF